MDIESILHKTLQPALGCTEPVAISLAVAAAAMATEGWSSHKRTHSDEGPWSRGCGVGEVMSSAGSDNQGMIATIPVYAYCQANGIDQVRQLRAIALSHLVTLYVTVHVGYLSSLCGVAIKAGIGAACGLTYAMGGGAKEISRQ